MKKKVLFSLTLVAFLGLAPSCVADFQAGNNLSDFSESAISKDLGIQPIYQLSAAFAPSIFSSITIKIDWSFVGSPLLFDSSCPLQSVTLTKLAKRYSLSSSFADSSYQCSGTSFFSMASRKGEGKEETFSFKENQGSGHLAFFYVADLVQHTWENASNSSFSVYVPQKAPYINSCAVN